MNFKIEDYSEFHTVDSCQLTAYPGWTVLGVYSQKRYEQFYTNGQCNSIEVERTGLLIGKRSDSVAALQQQEISNLKSEIHTQKYKIEDIERINKDHVREINNVQFKLDQKTEEINTLQEKMKPLKDQLYKMEADLGKVRKAIGDLQFNTIVGEKK